MNKNPKQEIEKVHSMIKKRDYLEYKDVEVGQLVSINHKKFHKDELFKIIGKQHKFDGWTVEVSNISNPFEKYEVSPQFINKK
jgi:hypothetical protein